MLITPGSAGFYKYVVQNVKDLELLMMHNRYSPFGHPMALLHAAC